MSRFLGKACFPSVVLCAFVLGAERSALGQIVINEFLASNVFTNFDEDGDTSDWVEFFNSGPGDVDLGGYYLSDDDQDLRKWQFPAITVPAGGFLLVWLSAKDRFVPPPEAISGSAGLLGFEPVFIAREAEWYFRIADPEVAGPPAGWNDADFVPFGWSRGNSGFGYGDGDDYTELPDQTNAVFIRKTFQVPDPNLVNNLVLRIDYDDGFVAYLNGTRVAAATAPTVEPDFTSVATGKREAGNAELYDLTPHKNELRAGDNVLAVVGLNDLPSSDMSLMPELGVVPLILHANFNLDREGEVLILTRPDGITPVDGLSFPPQSEDHSFGRRPDGSPDWYYFLTPTPRAANTSRGFSEPLSDRIEFDPAPGRYPISATVSMSAGLSDRTVIRYTTDGSEPTAASLRYTEPIPVSSSTVFRAAGFVEDERATRVISRSYIIGGNYALPILSISMDPEDYAFVHNTAGARGRASERPAYMELFGPTGRLSVATGFGMRLHGGAGRNGGFEIKKAYKAYFRGVYGATKLRYPIIPDTPVEEFDKLVLRSGFNDCFRTSGRAAYIRDQLIRDLHEEMGALVSHGSWCIVFVNMKYRGLFNIVERMDEEFLSSYLEHEDWDVIKTGNDVLVGTSDEWNRLRNFVTTEDFSQTAPYDQLLEMIDVENYTSYMILNLWAQNHDWPHNNWYAARRRVPDAKWIFLSWDAEFGIGLNPAGYSADSLTFALGRGGPIRDILAALVQNQGYRAYFVNEVDRHLNGVLGYLNVRNHILRLRSHILFDIPAEVAQFGRTAADWENNINGTLSFATSRGPIFWNFVQNHPLGFPEVTVPRVRSCVPSRVVNVGGAEVKVMGDRLDAETLIFLDDHPAENKGVSFSRLSVEVPFVADLSGPVDIVAVHPQSGESTRASGLLEIVLPIPEVQEIDPPEGAASGGETVVIRGRYFLDGVEVFFGDEPAPEVRRVEGGATELEVLTPPGVDSVEVLVVNRQPTTLEAATTVTFTYRGFTYLRGDANGDGSVDISDPIALLGFLFLGSTVLPCSAAADADMSDELDITDALNVLDYLFNDGPSLAPPFPDCGASQRDEVLSCDTPTVCR